jgi:hypothetical protein
MTMPELSLKHVAVDELKGRPVFELREIAADADAIKGAVQAELQRQADEALAALRDAGLSSPPPAVTGAKRGRKSNAEKAAFASSDAIDVTDFDEEPMERLAGHNA